MDVCIGEDSTMFPKGFHNVEIVIAHPIGICCKDGFIHEPKAGKDLIIFFVGWDRL